MLDEFKLDVIIEQTLRIDCCLTKSQALPSLMYLF
jgi:hypothetical protein